MMKQTTSEDLSNDEAHSPLDTLQTTSEEDCKCLPSAKYT